MRVFHLNCGSMCPIGGKLLPGVFAAGAVCHCLLVETRDRLVLVDTGLGRDDVAHPHRLGLLRPFLGFVPDPLATAHAQVRAVGYSPDDVTDIIPTHLDLDHAGGIADFPKAVIHVADTELAAARRRRSLRAWVRYRPMHLPSNARLQVFSYRATFGPLEVEGLPPEISVIALPGHSDGHCGVVVEGEGETPLLHAGDAYYARRELSAAPDLPLRLFQRVVHARYSEAMRTQRSLAEAAARYRMFSCHDPSELSPHLRQAA